MISLLNKYIICFIVGFLSLLDTPLLSQKNSAISWLTFDQLEDSLKSNPKQVFVVFYADWCAYCHEMDRVTFTDLEVALLLNNDYYALRMDVETTDTIYFGEQLFINERIKRRNPVHQIALMMASRRGKPFSLPAMVIFDEKFAARERYFQFLSAEQLIAILKGS
jgi:thioredoxin-related protein